MTILLAVASKHGATAEIGERLARRLEELGQTVQLCRPQELTDAHAGDALIIGSGVYMGGWLSELTKALPTVKNLGKTMPVWAFSSGPVGTPPVPTGTPERVIPLLSDLAEEVDFRGHMVFPGKVDRSVLKANEKLILKMVKAVEGDYRPWQQIDQWAEQISQAL